MKNNTPFEKVKGKTDEWYTPLERVKTIEKYIPKDVTIWCPFDTEQSYFVKQLGGARTIVHSHIQDGRDFFTYTPSEHFDCIVSNPPYIPSADIETLDREVKDHEPRLALDGGKDGLDYYRRIAQEASKYIAKGGTVILEVGIGEADKVVKLFKYCDYALIIKDLQGVDRFVKLVY